MTVGFLMIDQSKKGARSITLWRDKMVAYQFEKQVNQDRDQGCYYFNRSRPPEEIEVIFSKFLPWRLLCLKERGWGPPAEPKGGVHVNKTMKVKVSF
jgi:hypothetical protein